MTRFSVNGHTTNFSKAESWDPSETGVVPQRHAWHYTVNSWALIDLNNAPLRWFQYLYFFQMGNHFEPEVEFKPRVFFKWGPNAYRSHARGDLNYAHLGVIPVFVLFQKGGITSKPEVELHNLFFLSGCVYGSTDLSVFPMRLVYFGDSGIYKFCNQLSSAIPLFYLHSVPSTHSAKTQSVLSQLLRAWTVTDLAYEHMFKYQIL